MALFPPDDLPAAEAVAELCYTNPFTERRIALERQALGPAFIDTQAVWSRTSLRFRNPNVPGLRERTRQLLEPAFATLAAGRKARPRERELYAGLVRYYLYDAFTDEQMKLVDDVIAGRKDGAAEAIPHYPRFAELAERYFGADGELAKTQQVPHLFATSMQVLLSFSMIFDSLLGTSRAAAALRAATWHAIFTSDMRDYEEVMFSRMREMPVLILGQSGTGKELVASAIGKCGYVPFNEDRGCFKAPLARDFRALNLTAMSATLIESELFGHKRGAFTGAHDDRKGFFELCTEHGAVFLDEIGDLDPAVQLKLLRVLQSRSFERVGDAEPKQFVGRTLSATNRDLARRQDSGEFRSDLYYRLCGQIITTPSLCEQLAEAPDDLYAFVEATVERVRGSRQAAETPRARALIADIVDFIPRLGPDYPWPGNVRELEQYVRSFISTRDYTPLSRIPHRDTAKAPDLETALSPFEVTADTLLNTYCTMRLKRVGTIEATARSLGLNRRTLRSRLRAAGAGEG